MFKWLSACWGVINFLWKHIKPVYNDIMEVVAQVKAEGITDDDARKKAFQLVTDKAQGRGIKLSDSVINASLELCYQIYLDRQNKRK
jgi:hypothetical protein